MTDWELIVMAHRYLYYVLASPVISDAVYDELERTARSMLPTDSVVHMVGSSLPSSYTQEQIAHANYMLDVFHSS